ncbi:HIT family protein [Amphibacillus sp. Q70]|uniref:HIT family protein n=1 Tax=Amphibacillus sp. Q70 TaxID=3453416 RepID=UPI003F8731DF
MSKVMEDFKKKFKTKDLLIYETEYWVWSLRPVQATPGAGILSLKRECQTFSELNQEEFSDLNNIIKAIEKTLKKTFNYDIMNYLMLMMVDKQVHYHIIPRYDKAIDFIGLYWKDSGWPGVPNLAGEEIKIEILYEIQSIIKENLVL